MLVRSTDRKTANLANKAGTQAAIKNAFGLPSGVAYSCPGMTLTCEKVCYAGRLEKVFPGFRNAMLSNWHHLENATYDQMVDMLDTIVSGFSVDCDKKSAPKIFRIHHDGDFFSVDYAKAWATVVRMHPDIKFWVYTRSFHGSVNVISEIAGIENLTVYLSVDDQNKDFAPEILTQYPSVKIASLTKTFEEGKQVVRDLRGTQRPGAKCPELAGSLKLITVNGGACKTCTLCVEGKADIRFASSKK